MKYLSLICLILLKSICSASFAAKTLSCSGDFKLENKGFSQGSLHRDVERSGVVLVKDFGSDQLSQPNSRYAVILGHDANGNFWNFQAGKCEQKHQNTSETARDELKEETGGAVKMGSKEISESPYIYANQKQLFFVRNDQLKVDDLKKAVLNARNNPNLPYCEREIDDVEGVSLHHFLQIADQVRQKQVRQSCYLLTSLTGKQIQIDGYYFRMIAQRLPEIRVILDKLFQGKSQIKTQKGTLSQSKAIKVKPVISKVKDKKIIPKKKYSNSWLNRRKVQPVFVKSITKKRDKINFVHTKRFQKSKVKKS